MTRITRSIHILLLDIQHGIFVDSADTNPLTLEDTFTVMGAIFFGLEFDTGGPWSKRVGRSVVGMIGVLILWRGLGYLLGLLAHTILYWRIRSGIFATP